MGWNANQVDDFAIGETVLCSYEPDSSEQTLIARGPDETYFVKPGVRFRSGLHESIIERLNIHWFQHLPKKHKPRYLVLPANLYKAFQFDSLEAAKAADSHTLGIERVIVQVVAESTSGWEDVR